jgi:hypothetical protein
VWHSETKAWNCDNTQGAEEDAIGEMVVNDFAGIGASRGTRSGSKDVNEARLGGSIIPVPTRDGLAVFILLH